MRFAVYYHSRSGNVGDHFQTLAAAQLLPRVDCYIERDHPASAPGVGEVFLLANGWFTDAPRYVPPPPNVRPLYVGVHFARRRKLAPAADHFQRHGPVGCRDPWTEAHMRALGADAYYSGCLTLTLPPRRVARTGKAYLVDVPPEWVPPEVAKGAVEVRHLRIQGWSLVEAQSLLDLYAGAGLVVTTKLHCALPCLAYGTPVVAFEPKPGDPRFGALRDYVRVYAPGEKVEDWTPAPRDVRGHATWLTLLVKSHLP